MNNSDVDQSLIYCETDQEGGNNMAFNDSKTELVQLNPEPLHGLQHVQI